MLLAGELSLVAQMVSQRLQRLCFARDPCKDLAMVRPSHVLDGIDQQLRRPGRTVAAMQPVDRHTAGRDQRNLLEPVGDFDEGFTRCCRR
jgi:hypothetical protein